MEVYRRLAKYIKPYLHILIFASVFMILAAGAEVLVSGVIYITTNGLMSREFVTFNNIPHIPAQLAQIKFSVKWIPFIIVVVFFFRGFLNYVSKYLMALVGLRCVRDVRNDLYRHISYQSCDYFSEKHSGDLMSRVISDVKGIQNAITSIALDAVKSPFTILFTIPVIFIMGGKLAWFSVAIFPLVAIPIIILGRKLRKLARRFLERHAEIVSFLQETLIGIKIVKAFNAEEKENEKFREITQSLYDFSRKTVRAIELQRPLIEVMGAVGLGLAIYFALKTLPMDRFVTFAATLYLLYEPAKKLSKINVVIQHTVASGRRIFEVMDIQPSITDKPGAKVFSEALKEVKYNNVSFAYEKDNFVLRDISFTVKKGERVALVGPSGSGKSTLLSLLPRFYDPTKGTLTINGLDLRDIKVHSLRQLIGIVSQETILFSGAISDNIGYGKLDASFDDIVTAAKTANAHDFIVEFPDGYNTNIGERGTKLSGGQRQRISIARAILKNPPILIFDEATSHLDTHSEREVQNAIENLMIGRTVFVIAHRLSTVQSADRIIVLEAGKIVQMGSHSELISHDGPYKKLYELQFNI